jgi:hypothetical protein
LVLDQQLYGLRGSVYLGANSGFGAPGPLFHP